MDGVIGGTRCDGDVVVVVVGVDGDVVVVVVGVTALLWLIPLMGVHGGIVLLVRLVVVVILVLVWLGGYRSGVFAVCSGSII